PVQGSTAAASGINIFAPPSSGRPAAIDPIVSQLAGGGAASASIFAAPGRAEPSSDLLLADPPAPADDAPPLSQPSVNEHPPGRAAPDHDVSEEGAPGQADTELARPSHRWPNADDRSGIGGEPREGAEFPASRDADGGSKRFGFDAP